jgi:hypothetical protein
MQAASSYQTVYQGFQIVGGSMGSNQPICREGCKGFIATIPCSKFLRAVVGGSICPYVYGADRQGHRERLAQVLTERLIPEALFPTKLMIDVDCGDGTGESRGKFHQTAKEAHTICTTGKPTAKHLTGRDTTLCL